MKGKDFKPLQEERDGGTPSGQGGSRGRNFASELWGEVRGGAEHFQSTKGQLPRGRIRQFFYGAALPFHIARVTLANPVVRAIYVKVTALQTAFLLAIAAAWALNQFNGHELEAQEEEEAQQAPRKETPEERAAREQLKARIEQRAMELEAAKSRGDSAAMKQALGALIEETVNAVKAGDLSREEAAAVAEDAADEATAADREAKEAAAKADENASDAEDAEDSLGEEISAIIRAEVGQSLRDVQKAHRKGPRIQKEPQEKGFNVDAPKVRNGTFFLGSWEFWALFFGSLSAVQWIVVALSRDYHTVISREASLATGVPPEDPEIHPSVRLNVPWMRAKLQRRWRAFLLFVSGFPALVLLCIPLFWFPKSFTLLSSLWGFWWLLVFTAAKSDRAWMAPVTRPPWFVRAWSLLPVHGGLRWMMTGLARRSEAVAAPIATVERQPWVFAGLAFTRFVGSLPPFRCFTRPFIPVASAHLIGMDPEQPPALKGGESPPPHDAGD
ncbi:hypothetical protein JYK02_28210 [Corallococcus macrosporus]|uniref:Serine/threonine protein kinase n=1 Tax=Corallococcus macrosporus TaxID=35 RepID=A0ABS3DJ95_9BACT|nr:hypothetical protein [Corallococcus macrosporus]MBN8231402.1 hypothetical protein [Corallococcus macrosporus]